MLTKEQAQKLIEKILSYSTFPECEISINEPEEAFVRFANNGLTTSGLTTDRVIRIESSREGRTGAVTASEIDDPALKSAVARSEEIAAISPVNPEHVASLGPQEYPALDNFDRETASARSPLLIPHVRAIVDAALEKKLVAAGFFRRTARAAVTGNKKGRFGYHRTADAGISTTVRRPDGSSSGWSAHLSPKILEINGAALAPRAIEKCLRWEKPRRLEPGKYTVVLEAAATGGLVDVLESPFLGLGARSTEEGRTFLAKKGGGTLLGESLFPESITLRSDPFDPRHSALPWSAGVPNRKLPWIEKGVVKNLFYDRYWAAKSDKEPTIAPTSLILDGSDASLDDLIQSTERGLLVTRFWYIRLLNPQTLQLTGLTRDGLFLIEKGKITAPVMNFRFNESPIRLLQNVRRLGRPERVAGSMIAPPLIADNFNFASISDAV